MKLVFWHNKVRLHEADVAANEDGPLPKIVMVGAVMFLLDEVTCLASGAIEAQYQVCNPLILPPVQRITQHIFDQHARMPKNA